MLFNSVEFGGSYMYIARPVLFYDVSLMYCCDCFDYLLWLLFWLLFVCGL